ncbi:MAG: hypothetical protein ACM3US_10535 [Sphingomonadaceae bacterium]
MKSIPPQFRELRRERLVGNWGGASEQIGRRWEELGVEALRARISSTAPWPGNGYRPTDIVELAGDNSLQLALSRSGLPSPDVIVILQDEKRGRALQALDFKWNLEFASYVQIRAEAVRALLEREVAPLRALLDRHLADEDPRDLPIEDGLLYAPRLPVNSWFLQSDQNYHQEYPIEADQVLFENVDPLLFFGQLSGWELAVLLARADRSPQRLRNLEGAEHYYRIGAGLQSAVAQFQVSIFCRRPPTVTADAAFDWLKTHVRPASSAGFLQFAERLMAARSQLTTRLRGLLRSPYRFSDLVESLKVRNLHLPEKEDGLPAAERQRWGDILRKVAAEHKELVYRTGLRLVEVGLSDAEALARLEGDSRRFASQARARAEKLIAAALQP